MAKDSRSTFPIIDENGCPVDPTIFPRFTPEGTALQSVYEAFRFTESYGVIFQCNVKYCLGPCEPVRKYEYFPAAIIILNGLENVLELRSILILNAKISYSPSYKSFNAGTTGRSRLFFNSHCLFVTFNRKIIIKF